MKPARFFFAFFFITLGIMVLMYNLNSLSVWNDAWRLWPLALLLLGIVSLVKDIRLKAGLTSLAGSFAAFTLCSVILDDTAPFRDMQFGIKDGWNETGSIHSDSLGQYVSTEKDSAMRASLDIEAGAVGFSLSQPVYDKLLEAKTEGEGGICEISRNNDDKFNPQLSLRLSNHGSFRLFNRSEKRRAYIRLNPDILWDITMQAGAASGDLDFSPFRLQSLKIEGGASSMKIRLGMPADTTRISFEGGASSLQVQIPDSAGCQIEYEGGLSGRKFEGFTQVSENIYETPGFASANRKIYMDLTLGASSVTVKRYHNSISDTATTIKGVTARPESR
jgi:hypothetical protein